MLVNACKRKAATLALCISIQTFSFCELMHDKLMVYIWKLEDMLIPVLPNSLVHAHIETVIAMIQTMKAMETPFHLDY